MIKPFKWSIDLWNGWTVYLSKFDNHKGTLDKLHDIYHYLYAEWLKNSDYEFCPTAEIEWYDNRFIFASPDSEFDIYIPVK